MKRMMFAVIALVLVCASPGRAASGFDGKWTATVPGPSGQGGLPVTFIFTTENGKSGGSVSSGDQTFALVDVKIDGQTIAFAVQGEEQNRYTGTRAGDQIKMQVKYPSHENGTRVWSFVATRTASIQAVGAVDGDWTGDVPRGGGRVISATFTLHADGSILTGSVQAVGDQFPIEKGKIDGASLSFRVGGTQGEYSGNLGTDEIQMKVKYDGGESGRQTLPFVLKRVSDR
jgi:hypothetical protein